MFNRLILSLAARSLAPRRLLILTFHRVLPEPDPLLPGEPDAAVFARQMEFLGRNLTPVGLWDGVAALQRGTLPARAVAVTFDDGYANNVSVALPILKRYGIPATVFVATGLLNGGLMFNDAALAVARDARGSALDASALDLGQLPLADVAARRGAFAMLVNALKYRPPAERLPLVESLAAAARVQLPRDLMLTDDQVRALAAAGVEIGGHTVSHPILARLDAPSAAREISGSFARLREILGAPPRVFAYPNGQPGQDFGPEHVAMVAAAGYGLACTTVRGCARQGDDRLTLPRSPLWATAPDGLTRNLVSIYRDEGRRRS